MYIYGPEPPLRCDLRRACLSGGGGGGVMSAVPGAGGGCV